MSIPTDAKARKNIPLARGLLDYFPDALAAVAHVSVVGNAKHNPGQPLHWSKEKSTDHADSAVRHIVDRGKRDTDGERHSAHAAWRTLAMLQIEIEDEQKPLTNVDLNRERMTATEYMQERSRVPDGCGRVAVVGNHIFYRDRGLGTSAPPWGGPDLVKE